MSYEIIDNITRADIAFRVSGKNLNELFLSGAEALLSVMIENITLITCKIKKKAKFENSHIDLLLYDFLQEIVFFKDSESLILLPESMNFINKNNNYALECVFCGEQIDNAKHKINVDIKAVTMHNLKVEKTEEGWSGVFVLDV